MSEQNKSSLSPITTGKDGIFVEKSIKSKSGGVPTIVFKFVSQRDDSVLIELNDRIPIEIETNRIGFHQKYEKDSWEILEDNKLKFSREIDAGERLKTIYAIRDVEEENYELLMEEPTLTIMYSETKEDSTGNQTDEPFVHDVQEGVKPSETGEDLSILDGEDEEQKSVKNTENENTNVKNSSMTEEPSIFEKDGNITDAVVEELERGDIDDETKIALARQLNDHLSPKSSLGDVKIKQLQQRLSDIEAYSDALESFIDDNGTADELVEATNDDIDAIRKQVQHIEDELNEYVEDIEDVNDDVESVRKSIESTETDYDDLNEEIVTLRSNLKGIHSRIDVLAEKGASVEQLNTSIDEVKNETDETISTVKTNISEVEESVNNIEKQITEVSNDVESLKDTNTIDSSEVENVKESIDSLETKTNDVSEQIESVDKSVHQKVEQVETDIESIFNRLNSIDDKLSNDISEVRNEITTLETKFDERISTIDNSIDELLAFKESVQEETDDNEVDSDDEAKNE